LTRFLASAGFEQESDEVVWAKRAAAEKRKTNTTARMQSLRMAASIRMMTCHPELFPE